MKNKVTLIDSKYLTECGFLPFTEDGELQFYFLHVQPDGGTISMTPPSEENKKFNINNWKLNVDIAGGKSFGRVQLTCMCDSVEKFVHIMDTFEIPVRHVVKLTRSDAVAFMEEYRVLHPRCRACNRKWCIPDCIKSKREEVIQMCMDGVINKNNLKDYQ